MTPLQALTYALVEVEEQKMMESVDDEGFPDGDTALGCGDAEAILAALPDGWRLSFAPKGGAMQEGALRERKRLRAAVDKLPSVVFLPQDIERIYAGETLPLVARHALWALLNPEEDA